MGTTELNLLLKFGVPLAVKLLADGKEEKEAIEIAKTAVAGMASGGNLDIGDVLLAADEEQTQSIIDGFFGLITGVGDAFGNLLKALGGLLK